MAEWVEKKTNMILEVKVKFPPYCRLNRHGRKVAKVSIDCKFEGTQGKADLHYNARCRIFPKNRELIWEFSDDCSEAIGYEVMNLFTKEEIFNIFEKMELVSNI